jgi:hypothetical protein
MAAAAAASLYLQIHLKWDSDQPRDFAYLMLVTVGITTVVWVAITMLTAPEPKEKLVSFYRRVRPGGPGWKRIAGEAAVEKTAAHGLGIEFANAALGCILIYASLFAIGKIVLKDWGVGMIFVAVAVVSAVWISRNMSATRETGNQQ